MMMEEKGFVSDLGIDEREGYQDGVFRSQLRGFNDQGLSSRDNDTATTKFQWRNLLPESRGCNGGDVGKSLEGYRYGNCGRECGGSGEKRVPVENERIRNSPNYVNCGLGGNVSGSPVEDGGDFLFRKYPPNWARETPRKNYEGRHVRHLDTNLSNSQVEDGGDLMLREYPPNLGKEMPRKNYEGRHIKHSDRNVSDSQVEDVGDLMCRDYQPNLAREMSRKNYEGRHLKLSDRNASDSPLEDGGHFMLREYASNFAREMPRKNYEGRHLKHSDRNLSDSAVDDGEDFMFGEYAPNLAREMPRKNYEGRHVMVHCDDNPLHSDRDALSHYDPDFHSVGSSHGLTPRFQSSDQHTPCREDLMESLQGLRKEVLYHSKGFENIDHIQPERYNSHYERLCSQAGKTVLPSSHDMVKYPSTDRSLNTSRQGYYIHPECQRSEKVYPSGLSGNFYDQVQNVQGYEDQVQNMQGYGDQEVAFTSIGLDNTLQRLGHIGNSHEHDLIDYRRHSPAHGLQEEPSLGDYDVIKPAIGSGYGGMLSHENSHLEYGDGVIESYENLPYDENYFYDLKPHYMSYGKHKSYVSGSDDGVNVFDENTQQSLESGDFRFYDQPSRTLKRKHTFDKKMSRPKHRTSTFVGKGGMSFDNMQLTAEHEEEVSPRIRKLSSRGKFHMRENFGAREDECGLPFGGLSEALRSRLSKPHPSDSRDLKKRLKRPHNFHINHVPWMLQPFKTWKKNAKQFMDPSHHVMNDASAMQPYGKIKSAKKKLKAGIKNVTQDPQVSSHYAPNVENQQKSSIKNLGTAKEVFCSQESVADHLKLRVKPAEKDLPEDSEEFKRQVDELFFRCMLHFKANSEQQKRFKQGKAVSLKCIICYSSKEFLETKDIAMHAFTSLKVGLRAPHLGFHRALCVLNGWNSMVAPNGRWVCRSLPDAEAWALKEDIIIWPPVVIVHKSSGGNHLNTQVVVEHLGNFMKDEGFDVGKTKFCDGRAGDPNIMVVKFSGTLSGLREAERLHNFFAEKQHGRNELPQVSNAEAEFGCSKDAPQLPADNAENTLYGYLGIVEDLDKLHDDMKSHCHAKRKKETLAFADAAN